MFIMYTLEFQFFIPHIIVFYSRSVDLCSFFRECVFFIRLLYNNSFLNLRIKFRTNSCDDLLPLYFIPFYSPVPFLLLFFGELREILTITRVERHLCPVNEIHKSNNLSWCLSLYSCFHLSIHDHRFLHNYAGSTCRYRAGHYPQVYLIPNFNI